MSEIKNWIKVTIAILTCCCGIAIITVCIYTQCQYDKDVAHIKIPSENISPTDFQNYMNAYKAAQEKNKFLYTLLVDGFLTMLFKWLLSGIAIYVFGKPISTTIVEWIRKRIAGKP